MWRVGSSWMRANQKRTLVRGSPWRLQAWNKEWGRTGWNFCGTRGKCRWAGGREKHERDGGGNVAKEISLSVDTPRSEFRDTPSHLSGFIQITQNLFSSSIINLSSSCQASLHRFGGQGGMEECFPGPMTSIHGPLLGNMGFKLERKVQVGILVFGPSNVIFRNVNLRNTHSYAKWHIFKEAPCGIVCKIQAWEQPKGPLIRNWLTLLWSAL